MVCTNVLVLKSKHSQSCYLLSLFPFAQKFCLSFSKVPLSMVRREISQGLLLCSRLMGLFCGRNRCNVPRVHAAGHTYSHVHKNRECIE